MHLPISLALMPSVVPLRLASLFLLALLCATLGCSQREEGLQHQDSQKKGPQNQGSQIAGRTIVLAEGAYYRLPPPGIDKTAAYLTLHNQTSEDLELIGMFSSQVRKLELHEIVESDGRMAMRRRDSIVIPANANVELKPGGLHLMLFGLENDSIRPEDRLPLAIELAFATAQTGAELGNEQTVKKRLQVSLQPFDMRN